MQKSNNGDMQSKLTPEKGSKVAEAITDVDCIVQFMQSLYLKWTLLSHMYGIG